MISPYLHNRTLGAKIELAHVDGQSTVKQPEVSKITYQRRAGLLNQTAAIFSRYLASLPRFSQGTITHESFTYNVLRHIRYSYDIIRSAYMK